MEGAGQFLKAETPPVVAVAERGERGWEPDEGDESEPVLPAAAAKTEAWNDVKYLKQKERFSRHMIFPFHLWGEMVKRLIYQKPGFFGQSQKKP